VFKKPKLNVLCLLLLAAFILLASFLAIAEQKFASAAIQSDLVNPQVPSFQYENRTVYVSLWLINVYSFDYKTGSYTFDFYVFFYWTDPNISTVDWYLMNGYPTYPGAKLLVSSNYTGPVKWEYYRVRANLNTPLEPKNYPFDRIRLAISMELYTHSYDTSLVWLTQGTGIDAGFKNVGWTPPTFEVSSSISHYPVGIDSPRADMIIVQDRNLYGAIIETIIPPLIFCIVSLVCFLFQMHESAAFSLRVGINTSMLITAVLFNLAEQGNIPPITELTFYNVFMDSVISFLAINLVVTVVGYVDWMRNQDKRHVSLINRWGLIASVAVPLFLFLFLFFLK
jgi:hypothetical protein